MTELSIIKLLLDKYNYNKYNKIIYNIKTEKEIDKILYIIDKYYNEYTEHNYIALDELQTYFFLHYPSEKLNTTYLEIFSRLADLEVSDSVGVDIVRKYAEIAAANKIADKILPALDGKADGSILELSDILDEYRETTQLVDEEVSPFVEAELEDLIEMADSTDGYQWRLGCLNENIRPLSGASLGHVFARTEVGKTSFISSEVTHFASQLEDGEHILWACNEEVGERVKWRAYQSLLNLSADQIIAYYKQGRAQDIKDAFIKRGGDKILFLYDAALSYEAISEQLQTKNIKLAIIDIADHLTFRSAKDMPTHERLEALYRKLRVLSSTHDLPIISCGQASEAAAGQKQIRKEWLANSKTGKPGALDYIIGIGATYDPDDDETRWITISKNKIGTTVREVNEAHFDKLKGRYSDA